MPALHNLAALQPVKEDPGDRNAAICCRYLEETASMLAHRLTDRHDGVTFGNLDIHLPGEIRKRVENRLIPLLQAVPIPSMAGIRLQLDVLSGDHRVDYIDLMIVEDALQ